MNSGYSVTVRFADKGTPKKSGKPSKYGHVWLEVNFPDGTVKSVGFEPGEKLGSSDNFSSTDHKEYLNTKEHPIKSITAQISKEQAEKILDFERQVRAGKIQGVDSNPWYWPEHNSCIDMAGLNLANAGLASPDFQGVWRAGKWWRPIEQYDSFLKEMGLY
ncbi:hypothetical protein [Kingella potus]|uniref:hypothetical protein n=1 Tax=Kingella potus TaxID=265175 RepID=UPI0011C02D83|nr:hypothetical protein [Kingella potus]UOP01423.1 hypothetical protein LVJ84_04210 [Kingella potus]